MTVGDFRRAIELTTVDSGTVTGAVEDDFHHFEVTVTHDGHRVTGCSGRAVRHPWTTCPGAPDRLGHLVGMRLSDRCTAVGAQDDAHQHCTHLFDLAGLAVAHAWRQAHGGVDRRRYDAAVGTLDSAGHGAARAVLRRDGTEVLAWRTDRERVLGPEPYVDVRLSGAFLRWAEDTLDTEQAEAAIVLRRAVWISPGREYDVPTGIRADEAGQKVGACHSFQPERITIARWTGTRIDHAVGPGPLAR